MVMRGGRLVDGNERGGKERQRMDRMCLFVGSSIAPKLHPKFRSLNDLSPQKTHDGFSTPSPLSSHKSPSTLPLPTPV